MVDKSELCFLGGFASYVATNILSLGIPVVLADAYMRKKMPFYGQKYMLAVDERGFPTETGLVKNHLEVRGPYPKPIGSILPIHRDLSPNWHLEGIVRTFDKQFGHGDKRNINSSKIDFIASSQRYVIADAIKFAKENNLVLLQYIADSTKKRVVWHPEGWVPIQIGHPYS